MQPPTTGQIRTAIEVLKKLGEHINTRAGDSVLDLSESPRGTHQAGRIATATIEQTTRIEGIVTQLEQWRTGLNQQRRPYATHHI